MTEERFNDLVTVVTNGELNPPRTLFSGGFTDWRKCSLLARFLVRYHDEYLSDAIELFKTVTDQAVSTLEDIELKACYQYFT